MTNIHALDAFINRQSEVGVVPDWTRGDRLRKSLDVAGLTAVDMAEVQDVTPSTISRWLRDKSPMRRSHLMLWAIATGVDQAWLETGTAAPANRSGGDVYAIRDSNPEPADMSSRPALRVIVGVNEPLTVDRIPAGLPVPEPRTPSPGRQSGRHLRAVS
jgi:transcriptional regulator with XRE-family HTH domain